MLCVQLCVYTLLHGQRCKQQYILFQEPVTDSALFKRVVEACLVHC